MDYFDVIVHVMRADVRERYNLEDLWGDAPQLKVKGKAKAKVPTKRKRVTKSKVAAR